MKLRAQLLLFLVVCYGINSLAQSTPGVYPSILDNGCVNAAYSDSTNVIFVADTTVNVPPYGTFTLPLDSVQTTGFSAMPAGLAAGCLNGICTAFPPTIGSSPNQIIVFNGTPTLAQTSFVIEVYHVLWVTAPFAGVVSLNDTSYVEITINQPSSGTAVISTCDSLTWIDGNTYNTSNNTATYTLPNAVGCDSIITLDLSLNYSTSSTDIITSCDPITWLDGNTYTSSNQSATYVITNSVGCDSTINLDLTINAVDPTVSLNGITLTASATGIQYQWLDCDDFYGPVTGETNQSFTPTVNGNYAVFLDNGTCADTSDCTAISGVGIYENDLDLDITIYPNPTNDYIYINVLKPFTKIEMTLMDLSGQILYKQSTGLYIDLSNFAEGAYLLKVNLDEDVLIYKVIVE